MNNSGGNAIINDVWQFGKRDFFPLLTCLARCAIKSTNPMKEE